MIPQIPNTTFTDYQSHEDTSTEGAKRRIPQNRLTVLSGDLWVDPPHESRSKFSRLAGVVEHSCEPISIWSISHLFPILQWSNQNNLRSNITTSLIDQILTKQEIYQLQIKIFLFEIIRTPLCLIRSNRSQAREAQRWSKTGTKKKFTLCIIHIYSRQIVQKAVDKYIKGKPNNVFWSLSTTLSIHDIRVKKSFYSLSIGSISDSSTQPKNHQPISWSKKTKQKIHK